MAKKTPSSSNTGRGSGIKEGPPGSTKRYDNFVKKVNSIDDVKKLKKMIYNRNYRVKEQIKKDHPERAKLKDVVQFPPIEDLRLITASAFARLGKIQDPTKQVEELRKVIINTTRRKNTPVTFGDLSNREQDYVQNGVTALQEAIKQWDDDELRNKFAEGLSEVTVVDIHNIFDTIPSYWAISAGYYYAVTDFDNFIDELEILINRNGVTLTDREKNQLADRLFSNDPRR